jgi:hypothetical protein
VRTPFDRYLDLWDEIPLARGTVNLLEQEQAALWPKLTEEEQRQIEARLRKARVVPRELPTKLKDALLTLKLYGWRPLQAVGGVLVAGVSAPGGFEPYSSDERAAIEKLKKLGWVSIDVDWEAAGYRGSYVAPPNRAFEALWKEE